MSDLSRGDTPRAEAAQPPIELKLPCELLTRPTTSWSPSLLSRLLTNSVLPEPISPVNKENGACDSKAYSRIDSAIACRGEEYRNAGSGVRQNGFTENPK